MHVHESNWLIFTSIVPAKRGPFPRLLPPTPSARPTHKGPRSNHNFLGLSVSITVTPTPSHYACDQGSVRQRNWGKAKALACKSPKKDGSSLAYWPSVAFQGLWCNGVGGEGNCEECWVFISWCEHRLTGTAESGAFKDLKKTRNVILFTCWAKDNWSGHYAAPPFWFCPGWLVCQGKMAELQIVLDSTSSP